MSYWICTQSEVLFVMAKFSMWRHAAGRGDNR